MSDQIVQLSAADFDEAMAVMNCAFGKSPPSDFANLLPKLYRPEEDLMACNYAMVRDGGIKAVVGLFPLAWKVGVSTLRIAGIGGVSTHPECRGQGMMQRLMRHCLSIMPEQGYDLSYLGGQRQRYAYFGYEKCGVDVVFRLTRTNVQHCFRDRSGICFEAIDDKQVDRIAAIRALHDAQPVRAERPQANFYNTLLSWSCRPYRAFDGDDMVGYVVSDKPGGAVGEMLGRDDDTTLEIARAWVEQGPDGGGEMRLGPLAGGILHRLGNICERMSVSYSANWQVFDWVAVLEALLRARVASSALMPGRVALEILGVGTLAISVEGDSTASEQNVVCELVDEVPMLTCDSKLAHRLLFGPLPPSQVMGLPKEATALEAWCPLPMHWPRQDHV